MLGLQTRRSTSSGGDVAFHFSVLPFPLTRKTQEADKVAYPVHTPRTSFAMSETTLPSIATILQSTDVLSAPDASATVVRVGEKFAVKYGPSVTLLEAQNLSFVAENSNVPVPEMYGTLTEESTGRKFIVMEMVPGEPLAKAWPGFTSSEKHHVVEQIRRAMIDLRNIPPAGYIGSVAGQPCADGIFWTPDHPQDPALSGPFDTEDSMNEGILRKLESSEQLSYVGFLRTLMSTTLHSHRTFFTHGDLQPKNILVQRTSGTAGDAALFKIKIIDWETAGWYPEYWESCNATISARFNPDWLDIVQSAMPIYPHEYLMMQMIRQLMFY
jgi:serine/threonine protein kinase